MERGGGFRFQRHYFSSQVMSATLPTSVDTQALPFAGRGRHSTLAGFTLLELLVAFTVLAMLLVLLLQVANRTMQASRVTTQRLDATQAARHVIDSLAADIENKINVSSPLLYQPNGESVSLAFLTSARGPVTSVQPARFLAVSYQLVGHEVIRRYQGVDWGTKNLLDAAKKTITDGTASVLSPAILQFAVLALLEDGRTVVNLQNGTAIPPLDEPPVWEVPGTELYQGQVVPSGWSALVPATYPATPKSPRVQALLVAVAVVDEQNLAILDSTRQASLFDTPNTSDPVKEWEAILDGSALPGQSRSAVRFYSKVISLP